MAAGGGGCALRGGQRHAADDVGCVRVLQLRRVDRVAQRGRGITIDLGLVIGFHRQRSLGHRQGAGLIAADQVVARHLQVSLQDRVAAGRGCCAGGGGETAGEHRAERVTAGQTETANLEAQGGVRVAVNLACVAGSNRHATSGHVECGRAEVVVGCVGAADGQRAQVHRLAGADVAVPRTRAAEHDGVVGKLVRTGELAGRHHGAAVIDLRAVEGEVALRHGVGAGRFARDEAVTQVAGQCCEAAGEAGCVGASHPMAGTAGRTAGDGQGRQRAGDAGGCKAVTVDESAEAVRRAVAVAAAVDHRYIARTHRQGGRHAVEEPVAAARVARRGASDVALVVVLRRHRHALDRVGRVGRVDEEAAAVDAQAGVEGGVVDEVAASGQQQVAIGAVHCGVQREVGLAAACFEQDAVLRRHAPCVAHVADAQRTAVHER